MARIAELRRESARHLNGVAVYRRAAMGRTSWSTRPSRADAVAYVRQAMFNLEVVRAGREAAVAHGWRLP